MVGTMLAMDIDMTNAQQKALLANKLISRQVGGFYEIAAGDNTDYVRALANAATHAYIASLSITKSVKSALHASVTLAPSIFAVIPDNVVAAKVASVLTTAEFASLGDKVVFAA